MSRKRTSSTLEDHPAKRTRNHQDESVRGSATASPTPLQDHAAMKARTNLDESQIEQGNHNNGKVTEQSHWSEEDEQNLQFAEQEELHLWGLCNHLFNGQTPLDILPNLLTGLDNGFTLSAEFCADLTDLLSCPALQNQSLLLYALQTAMHSRLNTLSSPDRKLLISPRNKKIIEQFVQQCMVLPDAFIFKLDRILNEEFGQEAVANLYIGFVAHIQNIVETHSASPGYEDMIKEENITLFDLKVVAAAWDGYVNSEQQELYMIKEYAAIVRSSGEVQGLSREAFCDVKRAAVIAQRKKYGGKEATAKDDEMVDKKQQEDNDHADERHYASSLFVSEESDEESLPDLEPQSQTTNTNSSDEQIPLPPHSPPREPLPIRLRAPEGPAPVPDTDPLTAATAALSAMLRKGIVDLVKIATEQQTTPKVIKVERQEESDVIMLDKRKGTVEFLHEGQVEASQLPSTQNG